MTGPQKNWLDEHRPFGYRVVGQLPGGSKWTNLGMLYPDGTFERRTSAHAAYSRAVLGMFEVGVLQQIAGLER